jgi:hypothetical protein
VLSWGVLVVDHEYDGIVVRALRGAEQGGVIAVAHGAGDGCSFYLPA